MSGHSKWSSIKHKKAIADKKRGQVFSKFLNTISVAARDGTDPQFNSRLKSAIEQAKKNNVPQGNIERAIKKASGKETEEMVIEAYGPGGVAMIIKASADNHNRTISEIKHVLSSHNSKIAEPGSVLWSFNGDKPKFTQEINEKDRSKLNKLLEELENRSDVQKVITNLK